MYIAAPGRNAMSGDEVADPWPLIGGIGTGPSIYIPAPDRNAICRGEPELWISIGKVVTVNKAKIKKHRTSVFMGEAPFL